MQANSEKSERKVLAIPSIVEKVKAASPQKLDYGLDYYGNVAPGVVQAVFSRPVFEPREDRPSGFLVFG